MEIAYALAADHSERVARLVVGEAIITGVTPSPPLLLPGPLNTRLWHIAFNRLDGRINEALVRGREDIFFGAEYAHSAGTLLPPHVVKYYVDGLASSPDALRGSFASYRAIDITMVQNAQRKARRLTLPVLAIGGGKSGDEGIVTTMKLAADDVQGVIIPGSGHWVAEEAPEALLRALQSFLAPYRDDREGSMR
jgi:pimeloyl-ACP methyl ester carboxylesterase